ncbi:MAG: transcription-repair coupling factor [Thermovibrio sp.]|nr:MAG: transcription-repair coupling factor [Thermovibrio sp.]
MFKRNVKLVQSQIKEGQSKATGLPGSSKTLLLKEIVEKLSPLVVFLPTEQLARAFSEDLKREGLKSVYVPSWDVPPLDVSSPLSSVQYERLRALYEIFDTSPQFVVLTPSSFLQKVVSPEFLIDRVLEFKKGSEINLSELPKKLTGFGFRRVDSEPESGEFSLKGSFLEIVTPLNERIEVEFFGDEIETLKVNDLDTKSFTLVPTLELPTDEETLEKLSRIDREISERHSLLGELSGAEKFLPDVVELVSITEYIGNFKAVFIEPEQIRTSSENFVSQVMENYEILKREGVSSSSPEKFIVRELPKPILLIYEKNVKNSVDFKITPLPFVEDENLKEIVRSLQGYEVKLIYQTETLKKEAEKLFNIYKIKYSLERGSSLGGYKFEEGRRALIAEGTIEIPVKKGTDITELEPGTLVVHRDYGIGVFQGIVSREVGGKLYDFIEIEYAGGEKLYAPFTQIDRIYRYTGYRGKNPKLDRLGGTSWKNLERRIKASLERFARELTELYKKRKSSVKEKIVGDEKLIREFERRFPYRLTPDQQRAIREVYRDMESEKPMDRLLCGDVGFGKTEVAMRAAMKAVSAGKQVAVVVPTTVLADQHYRTFKKRFSGFPVEIELLSRFRTKKEQEEILRRLGRGEIDIVIGTHRLTQDDVKFKDLGLLIIDEEHRFGVKTKEKLTKLKSNIDVLYLSATPIPRTLYSALSGFRDISKIETPPAGRRGTKVVVGKYTDTILKTAVEREVSRNGQVFIVHNDISALPEIKEKVEKFFPNVKVEIAHGQMRSSQIEKTMHQFFEGKIQVLISTSIVESGLDVPSANTLIVIGAERFGLSQLYQLKGRVGRGVEKGYCYLLTSPNVKLTPEAIKRLEAMKKLSPLGGGFQLALRDLEIRGAGTLLGPKQSGFVESVGLELYTKLLEEITKERKEEDVKINIPFEAFIPDTFIEDPKEKVKLYSQMASSENPEEFLGNLKKLRGYLPDPVVNLFKTMQIKKIAKELGIKEVSVTPSMKAIISFGESPNVSPETLVSFVKEKGTVFTSDRKLYFDVKDLDELIEVLRNLRERENEESSNSIATHSSISD